MDIGLDKTQETGMLTLGQRHCCVQSQLVNKHTRTKIKTWGEWVMCNMGLLSNGLLRHEFDFRHIKCSTPLYKVQIQIKLPWESLYIFYVWHWAVRLNRLQLWNPYELWKALFFKKTKQNKKKQKKKNTQLKLVCKHHHLQALLCDGTSLLSAFSVRENMSRSLENAHETTAAVIGWYAAAHARGRWGRGASVGNIQRIHLSCLDYQIKNKKNWIKEKTTAFAVGYVWTLRGQVPLPLVAVVLCRWEFATSTTINQNSQFV